MTSFVRIEHAGGAIDTTLNGDISSGANSLALTAGTNWPTGSTGPFYLVIDPGLSNEEKILATARSTNSLTGLTRGVDGTSAAAHSSGAVVKHCFSAQEADEANQIVKATLGTVAAKGDLLPGSAANTISKLTVGSDNAVLVADASQSTGMKWATLTSSSLATNSVGTSQIAANAVDDTKIATGALDGATLTGGGGSVVKVANGGITATQLAANAVTTAAILDANVTTSKIADANVTAAKLAASSVLLSKFDSTVRPVTICTSGTHPGSPTVGDHLFENDSGNELSYQSGTTLWTPPWNVAWGEIAYKQITSAGADLGTSATDILTGITATFVANRVYGFRFNCANITAINGDGFWKIYLTNNSSTLIKLFGQRDILQSKRDSIDAEVRVTGIAAGSATYKVMGTFSNGAGAGRVAASGTADPGPIWCSIRDLGPNGAPA